MRKTKIVATLGPATDDPKILRALLLAGLDVARFNFSHEQPETLRKRVEKLCQLREELDSPVALLADTQGPEVRIGRFENGRITLVADQEFIFTTEPCTGDENHVFITYAGLPNDVREGTQILIDDGLIELTVTRVSGNQIITRVINGGVISDRKSVNVPGTPLRLPFISSKDRVDLRLAVELGFDVVAASFTRGAEDIRQLRDELHRLSGDDLMITAKIENAEGIHNIDEILTVADGVMVARGDLGVEVPLEELPILQKEIIKKAYRQGKHVITATQMLESMIKNPRPTRAEISDVANAIYDGTSAIMLSGETAAGAYPVEAFKTMVRIAERTERDIDYKNLFHTREFKPETTVTNAIAEAAVTTAHELLAAAIVTVTRTGMTARNVAKFRPACPVFACTTDARVRRQLSLSWGIIPLLLPEQSDAGSLFDCAANAAKQHSNLEYGDLLVMTSGLPIGVTGTTNMLKVHELGEHAPVL